MELCKGRFEPLKVYFEGISKSDFDDFTSEDLIDIVKSKHKLLMKLFVKKYETLLNIENPFQPDCYTISLDSPITLDNILKNGSMLLLDGKIISNKYCVTSFFTINKAISLLTHIDKTKIKYVSLTANNLENDDVPDVQSLINLIPNCEVLDISYNRFGLDESTYTLIEAAIIYFLGEPNLKYINITHNMIASINYIQFLRKIVKKYHHKLIFIPKNIIKHRSWKDAIALPNLESDIIQTHNEFYDNVILK